METLFGTRNRSKHLGVLKIEVLFSSECCISLSKSIDKYVSYNPVDMSCREIEILNCLETNIIFNVRHS